MPGTPTPKHGIPTIAGTDIANTIDATNKSQMDALDAIIAIDDQGLLSARPTSTPGTPGKKGRFYTDEFGTTWRDHGTGWHAVGGKMPHCALDILAGSALASATERTIAWAGAGADDIWDMHAADAAQIVLPYAGIWRIEVNYVFSAHATGYRDVKLLVGITRRQVTVPAVSGAPTRLVVAGSMRLPAGAVVEASALQTSGTTMAEPVGSTITVEMLSS